MRPEDVDGWTGEVADGFEDGYRALATEFPNGFLRLDMNQVMASGSTRSPPTPQPLHYGIVMFPGYQALDMVGPMDCFNLLKTLDGEFFDPDPSAAQTAEPMRTPKLTLTILAETYQPVPTFNEPREPHSRSADFSFSSYMLPNCTFAEYLKAHAPDTSCPAPANLPALDVLIIPGGIGTRFRLPRYPPLIPPVLEFIHLVAPSLRTGILSICTGAELLCQSHILPSGTRLTSNKHRLDIIKNWFPDMTWIDEARWVHDVVHLGHTSPHAVPPPPKTHIYSSSGILAGVDLTLSFIAAHYTVRAAVEIATRLEHDWDASRSGETGWRSFNRALLGTETHEEKTIRSTRRLADRQRETEEAEQARAEKDVDHLLDNQQLSDTDADIRDGLLTTGKPLEKIWQADGAAAVGAGGRNESRRPWATASTTQAQGQAQQIRQSHRRSLDDLAGGASAAGSGGGGGGGGRATTGSGPGTRRVRHVVSERDVAVHVACDLRWEALRDRLAVADWREDAGDD